MEYILGPVFFFFGAVIGSFISVVANRYNTGLSFWKGRSFCFSCNTQLVRKDLVPIFSFLFLRGRCWYCKSKIPKETFASEIVMGMLSVVAALKSGLLSSLELGAWSLEVGAGYLLLTAIFAVILLISIYDLKHFIIPDSFLITFFILALIYNLLPFVSNFYFALLSSKLLALSSSSLFLTLPFLLIFIISKGRWLGFGDVKYIAVIGFFLGIIQGISAVILAFWIGAVFSLLALLLKKIKSHIDLPMLSNNLTIKSEIPFGPFLSLGILISFYFALDIFQIGSLLNAF